MEYELANVDHVHAEQACVDYTSSDATVLRCLTPITEDSTFHEMGMVLDGKFPNGTWGEFPRSNNGVTFWEESATTDYTASDATVFRILNPNSEDRLIQDFYYLDNSGFNGNIPGYFSVIEGFLELKGELTSTAAYQGFFEIEGVLSLSFPGLVEGFLEISGTMYPMPTFQGYLELFGITSIDSPDRPWKCIAAPTMVPPEIPDAVASGGPYSFDGALVLK